MAHSLLVRRSIRGAGIFGILALISLGGCLWLSLEMQRQNACLSLQEIQEHSLQQINKNFDHHLRFIETHQDLKASLITRKLFTPPMIKDLRQRLLLSAEKAAFLLDRLTLTLGHHQDQVVYELTISGQALPDMQLFAWINDLETQGWGFFKLAHLTMGRPRTESKQPPLTATDFQIKGSFIFLNFKEF